MLGGLKMVGVCSDFRGLSSNLTSSLHSLIVSSRKTLVVYWYYALLQARRYIHQKECKMPDIHSDTNWGALALDHRRALDGRQS